jgi:hypothetical protein
MFSNVSASTAVTIFTISILRGGGWMLDVLYIDLAVNSEWEVKPWLDETDKQDVIQWGATTWLRRGDHFLWDQIVMKRGD